MQNVVGLCADPLAPPVVPVAPAVAPLWSGNCPRPFGVATCAAAGDAAKASAAMIANLLIGDAGTCGSRMPYQGQLSRSLVCSRARLAVMPVTDEGVPACENEQARRGGSRPRVAQ